MEVYTVTLEVNVMSFRNYENIQKIPLQICFVVL